MNRRHLLVGAGIAAFLLGVGEMATPGIVPVPVGVTTPTVLGLLVLVYAVQYLRSAARVTFEQAETPEVETPLATAPPGANLDAALAHFRGERPRRTTTRTRTGLRAAAVDVLTRYEGLTPPEARRRVDDGTWTDDPHAAAFLRTDGSHRVRFTDRLRNRLARVSRFERAINHVVAELERIAGVSRTSTDRVSSPGDGTSETGSIDPAGTRSETNHWVGVGAIALIGLGAGLLVEQPAVALAAVVGIGYAAYARAVPLVEPELSVERTVSDEDPSPDEEVEVTVTITNEGSAFLPDVRVVDGVPEPLAVSAGSPRYGTSLRAGASASFSYSVTARRGRHEFQPTLVVARNLPGAVERAITVDAATTVTCVPSLQPTLASVPIAPTAQYAGPVATDTGGDGVEFHATRQYLPGDAKNRIDWHRRARTGELATLEFRQERSATIVLLIDVQPSAYVSPDLGTDHAVDRSVEAARRVFARLLDDGHQVGIGTLGPVECWLQPGSGTDHRLQGRRLLAVDPALRSIPQEDRGNPYRWKRRLRRQLPSGAQLIVFSPLCGSLTDSIIAGLATAGHPTTVVSPDPTVDHTVGHRLARVQRRIRTTDLRRGGVTVVDWPATDSLDEALATAIDGSSHVPSHSHATNPPARTP